MKDVVSRLQALGPVITRLCSISGTQGVSLGVLHHDEIIHTAGYGIRDIQSQLRPDEDTLYHLGSLTKAYTAAAIGILVEETSLSWETTVVSILPGFDHYNETVRNKTTLVDILAHRTGLTQQNALWMQEHGHLSLDRDQTLVMASKLKPIYDFRSQWSYNNYGPAIAALIVEKISGISWGQFLKTRIFDPLGHKRTTTARLPGWENVAKPYIPLSDGTPVPLDPPYIADGAFMSGTAGTQSTVKESLFTYRALLASAKNDSKKICNETTLSPFKQTDVLLSAHIPMPGESLLEQSYALGWVRTKLPAPLGTVGMNPGKVAKMPDVGRGSESRLVIHHNGALGGFLSAVLLLPESQSVIVVFTNTLANNDCADWIAQLLLEALIDNEEKNDYEALAQESVAGTKAEWTNVAKTLQEELRENTTSKPLSIYEGKYYNKQGNWFLHVFLKNGQLVMCEQGDWTETYTLKYCHDDVFSWEITQDESARRGRYPYPYPLYYLLNFQSSSDGISSVLWIDDGAVPEGEIFTKVGKSAPASQEVLQE